MSMDFCYGLNDVRTLMFTFESLIFIPKLLNFFLQSLNSSFQAVV
eukprot:06912.XXX_247618_247752_1 [CDS] Oithona nana genome sequencing.